MAVKLPKLQCRAAATDEKDRDYDEGDGDGQPTRNANELLSVNCLSGVPGFVISALMLLCFIWIRFGNAAWVFPKPKVPTQVAANSPINCDCRRRGNRSNTHIILREDRSTFVQLSELSMAGTLFDLWPFCWPGNVQPVYGMDSHGRMLNAGCSTAQAQILLTCPMCSAFRQWAAILLPVANSMWQCTWRNYCI